MPTTTHASGPVARVGNAPHVVPLRGGLQRSRQIAQALRAHQVRKAALQPAAFGGHGVLGVIRPRFGHHAARGRPSAVVIVARGRRPLREGSLEIAVGLVGCSCGSARGERDT